MKILMFFLFCTLVPTTWEQYLTNSTYISYKNLIFNPNSSTFVEVTDSCQHDDNWKFETDHTMSIREGQLRCDTLLPLIPLLYDWALDENTQALFMINDQDTMKFKVISINQDSLVLGYPYSGNSPKREIIKLSR